MKTHTPGTPTGTAPVLKPDDETKNAAFNTCGTIGETCETAVHAPNTR